MRICGLFVRFKCWSLGFGQLLFLEKISINCSLAHLLLDLRGESSSISSS